MKAPALTYEVLPACKDILEAVADLNTVLGGEGRIYVADGDELLVDFPKPDKNGFSARVVLMDVMNGVGNAPENLAKVLGYRFKIRIDLMPVKNPNYNAKETLEFLHKIVYMNLSGQIIDMNDARQITTIRRTTAPTSMFSTKQGWKYMSANYLTILKP